MPAKRARTDAERELLVRLAARLPRAELESLVKSHVRSGTPFSRADLEVSLRSRDGVCAHTGTSASAGHTGTFALLDDALLAKIFAYLRPIARVRAVTSVCKSWRSLRGCAELFADVNDDGRHMPLYRLERLLNWLPAKGAEVRKATVHSEKETNARLPTVMVGRLPALQELRLTGPKITASAVAAVAKSCGASLRALRFAETKDTAATNLTQTTLAAAAKQLALLEELEVPRQMLYSWSAEAVVDDAATIPPLRALSDARAGAAPLLRTLVVGRDADFECLPCIWLRSVGAALPELEVLRVFSLNYNEGAFVRLVGPARAWAPLPRLRDLEVTSAGSVGSRLTSEQLGTLLELAFGAAPRLEALRLDAGGVPSRFSSRVPRPRPALGGALQRHAPPKSLRVLALRNVDIAATDFDGVDLPRLAKLELRECGPLAEQAAAALAARYQAPRVLECSCC